MGTWKRNEGVEAESSETYSEILRRVTLTRKLYDNKRVFERGETRFYNFIEEKISLVVDIYDSENYPGNKHYYNEKNKLTSKNKLSPP